MTHPQGYYAKYGRAAPATGGKKLREIAAAAGADYRTVQALVRLLVGELGEEIVG